MNNRFNAIAKLFSYEIVDIDYFHFSFYDVMLFYYYKIGIENAIFCQVLIGEYNNRFRFA